MNICWHSVDQIVYYYTRQIAQNQIAKHTKLCVQVIYGLVLEDLVKEGDVCRHISYVG